MIHPDTVEQILDKARIEEVISDFISLKKSGSNYKGCCPFHNEKTPSFMVSPAKGIFKCFGCAKGGNAVSFVMDHERLTYVDALKYLAKKYHIEVVETQVSEEDKQKKDIRESLQVVNNFANTYFKQKLLDSK
ncbi:MAG TPA: CHC2 zinc finger domain-containing protein, partial [Bacteroidales bacterium]|nr:CHC2 zinc finger domain-containing protein [Bacteroidales bacterium]